MRQQTINDHSNRPQTGPSIVRIHGLVAKTGLSRSYIYHLAKQGLFPKSIPLVPGGKSRGWIVSEVDEWLNSRIAERDMEV